MDINPDVYFMKQALLEARKAGERDEVPIGAVIVCQGRIIARGGCDCGRAGLFHREEAGRAGEAGALHAGIDFLRTRSQEGEHPDGWGQAGDRYPNGEEGGHAERACAYWDKLPHRGDAGEDKAGCDCGINKGHPFRNKEAGVYSTVTDFARFLGRSGFIPLATLT